MISTEWPRRRPECLDQSAAHQYWVVTNIVRTSVEYIHLRLWIAVNTQPDSCRWLQWGYRWSEGSLRRFFCGFPGIVVRMWSKSCRAARWSFWIPTKSTLKMISLGSLLTLKYTMTLKSPRFRINCPRSLCWVPSRWVGLLPDMEQQFAATHDARSWKLTITIDKAHLCVIVLCVAGSLQAVRRDDVSAASQKWSHGPSVTNHAANRRGQGPCKTFPWFHSEGKGHDHVHQEHWNN